MRIIGYELKKIWNPKLLLVIALISALFYYLFMAFLIDHYPNGWPATSDIEYARMLVERYGNTVAEEQVFAFTAEEREQLITRAEKYIKNTPVFAAAGVYSYADLDALRILQSETDDLAELTQEQNDALWAFSFHGDHLGMYFQSLNSLESDIEWFVNFMNGHYPDLWDSINPREQSRLMQIYENGEHNSVFHWWTYMNTTDYSFYFSVLLVLATLILVSPLIVTDRHSKLHYLQYSSKAGRRILNSQLAATLISSFALTTAMLLVFGGIYTTNGTVIFWNSYISSVFNHGIYSTLKITYGTWVIVNIVFLYAVSLATASIAFVLSRFSNSLISLVIKLVPMCTALIYISSGLFNGLLMMNNLFYSFTRIPGMDIIICVALGIIALTSAALVLKRERRVDVL